jgi:hypothetical protein
MSLNIDQIAEAFCSHRFGVTYPYMADEIRWNIVGKEERICLPGFFKVAPSPAAA